MARLFYAWELGANLGHVGTFLPLAQALRQQGHQLEWAVSQPANVGRFLDEAGFEWLPAPVTVERQRPGLPLSYADILLRFGYDEAAPLLGLVGAWRSLLQRTGAELVLADHAPTAMLAARSLGCPVMLFSSGFTAPPALTPLPNMRPWLDIADETLRHLDATALAASNSVLQRFGCAPMKRLADLFAVDETALLTFPELDHYPARGEALYWGSLPHAVTGAPPPWPDMAGSRCFAYLRQETPHLRTILAALARRAGPTLVFLPGTSAEFRTEFAAPQLRFLDRPADLETAAREADLAITYAGLASTTAFLLSGCPLLLLPGHLEQYLLARRVAELGAAIVHTAEQEEFDAAGALAALEAGGYGENARRFAHKYGQFSQPQVVHHLVRRIEALARRTGENRRTT